MALLALAGVARADQDLDDNSLNLNHAYAPIDGAGLTHVDGGRTLGQGQVHASVGTSYAENPLEVGTSGDRRTRGILFQTLVLDLTASVGLVDGLSVGVALPVVLNQDGRDDLDTGSDVRGSGLGQARVQLKWSFLDGERVSLAVAPYLTLPTGRRQDYLSDNGAVGGGAFAAATVRFGRLAAHGTIGWEDLSSDGGLGDLQVPARIRFGLGLEAVLLRGRAPARGVHREAAEGERPPRDGEDGGEGEGAAPRSDHTVAVGAELFGWTNIRRPFHTERERPIEWLGSLRWRHACGAAASFGGGVGLNNGIGAPDWRLVFTLSFDF